MAYGRRYFLYFFLFYYRSNNDQATRVIVEEVLLVDHVALQQRGRRLCQRRQELRRDNPGRDRADKRGAHHADRIVRKAPHLLGVKANMKE